MDTKKVKPFWIILYFLLGCFICTSSRVTGIIYFTVLPFHLWMVSFFYSRKHFLLTLFSIIILVAIGLNSIFFFLADSMDDFVGMNTLGSFNKEEVFIHAYKQIFIFCLAIVLLSLFSKQKKSSNILQETLSIIRSYFGEGSKFTKTNKAATVLLIILVPLMSYVSLWMYNHNVGILGLKQTVLPHHMTGVLFYTRRFLFPIVLIYLFVKSPNKWLSFILLSIYAIIASASGASKSLGLLITIPLILLSYGYKKYYMLSTSIFLTIFVFVFVTACRSFIYLSDTPLYTIEEVFTFSWDIVKESDWNTLTDFFVTFSGRLFGINLSIVGDQYNQATLSDLIYYYFGVNIGSIVPNLDFLILGREMPEDRAFGTALGYIASMILLASDNFLLLIIQCIFIYTILNTMEILIQRIFNTSTNVFIKFGVVAFAAFAVMKLNDGLSLKPVYLILVLLYIVDKLVKKHNHQKQRVCSFSHITQKQFS